MNVLLDEDGTVSQAYGVSGFPTTFIINRDGTVFTYIPNMTDKETVLDILGEIGE